MGQPTEPEAHNTTSPETHEFESQVPEISDDDEFPPEIGENNNLSGKAVIRKMFSPAVAHFHGEFRRFRS